MRASAEPAREVSTALPAALKGEQGSGMPGNDAQADTSVQHSGSSNSNTNPDPVTLAATKLALTLQQKRFTNWDSIVSHVQVCHFAEMGSARP